MKFLIKSDELLQKFNDIWNKVTPSIKKELHSKPISKIFWKTKIRFIKMRLQIFILEKYLKQALIKFAGQ